MFLYKIDYEKYRTARTTHLIRNNITWYTKKKCCFSPHEKSHIGWYKSNNYKLSVQYIVTYVGGIAQRLFDIVYVMCCCHTAFTCMAMSSPKETIC